MLGAIIGDIVGSRFEFKNHRSKEFELFTDDCFFTDDSIMTLAIAKAVMDCKEDRSDLSECAVNAMQQVGRPYPYSGYGGSFFHWMYSENPEPYNSFGNGAAMRVSACGWAGNSLEEVKDLSRKVTQVTHDHPEGIKGAEATAVAIYLARMIRVSKLPQDTVRTFIRDYISTNYYPLNFTLDSIRSSYRFNETCQNTVPQAIVAFLESTDFEDAIRNAISIGGDSDTLAAITGSIAEAFYGIPKWMKEEAKSFLDRRLNHLLDKIEEQWTFADEE